MYNNKSGIVLSNENIKQIFIHEKRWFKKLSDKSVNSEGPKLTRLKKLSDKTIDFEGPKLTILNIRLRVIFGLLSILYQSWHLKKSIEKFFLVCFYDDEIAQSLINSNPKQFLKISLGFKTLIFGKQSLFELDALYYLINYKNIFGKKLRKLLLRIFISWLKNNYKNLMQNVFVVKQDYSGLSSVLVTLSKITSLRVIGIQHGLMDCEIIRERRIYPGFRTNVEFVYTNDYSMLFQEIKPANTDVYVIGPPFDCGSCSSNIQTSKNLFFISSGDLAYSKKNNFIKLVSNLSNAFYFNFEVRPHPHERGILREYNYTFNHENVIDFLRKNGKSTIFMGYYSTLMYWVASRGLKTIWILDDDFPLAVEDLNIIRSCENSTVINSKDITGSLILSIFKTDPVPLQENLVSDRFIFLANKLHLYSPCDDK